MAGIRVSWGFLEGCIILVILLGLMAFALSCYTGSKSPPPPVETVPKCHDLKTILVGSFSYRGSTCEVRQVEGNCGLWAEGLTTFTQCDPPVPGMVQK